MARGNERSTSRRSPKDAARRTKKKPCALCRDKIEWVDYKDFGMLRKYMSDRGKIRARRVTGNCTQHQREVALAIKTARELVLLPYTQRTTAERSGGRGRGGRQDRPDRVLGAGRPRAGEDGAEARDGSRTVEVDEATEPEQLANPGLAEDGSPEPSPVASADGGEVAEVAEVAGTSGNGPQAEPADAQPRGPAAGNGAAAGDVTGNGS